MKKQNNKIYLYLLITLAVVLVLGIVAFFYFGVVETGGYAGDFVKSWSANYDTTKQEITYSFSLSYNSNGGGDTNARLDPHSCFDLTPYGKMPNGNYGGGAWVAYISGADQQTCGTIGGTWDNWWNRGLYVDGAKQEYRCYWDSIDFSNYYVKNLTLIPSDVTFDFDRFSSTKTFNICNPTENYYQSASVTIVLDRDFVSTFYHLENNNCSMIQIKNSQKTNSDYLTSQECQANVLVPHDYYRFAENKCTLVNIYDSDKTVNDYETLKECEANISSNWQYFVLAGAILVLVGFTVFIIYMIKKKKN